MRNQSHLEREAYTVNDLEDDEAWEGWARRLDGVCDYLEGSTQNEDLKGAEGWLVNNAVEKEEITAQTCLSKTNPVGEPNVHEGAQDETLEDREMRFDRRKR